MGRNHCINEVSNFKPNCMRMLHHCWKYFYRLTTIVLLAMPRLGGTDLLCRSCGNMVTTASAIRNVQSDRAEERWNISVLGVNTLIQSFRNPSDEVFNVITVKGADLKFYGESYSAETWFPGMRWTACVCSSCGTHLGWYFKSTNDDFVGLVLDYTIGSEYANTLTVVPKIAENHKHIGHESTDL